MTRKLCTVLLAIFALCALVVAAIMGLYLTTETTPAVRAEAPFFPAVFVPAGNLSEEVVVYDFAQAPHREPDNVMRPAFPLRLEKGWSGQEVWGTWTVGATTVFGASWSEPRDRHFSVRGWALAHPGFPKGQQISVVVNGHHCGEVTFPDTPTNRRLSIPAAAQVIGYNRIELHHAYTASPAELGMSADDRPLALGVCSLGFATGDVRQKLPSRKSRRVAAMLRRFGLSSEPFTIDRADNAFIIRTAGTVVLPPLDHISDGPQILTVRAAANFDRRDSSLRITTVSAGGRRRTSIEVAADAWQRVSLTRGWRTEVEIHPHGNLTLIEAEPTPTDAWMSFSSPVLGQNEYVHEAQPFATEKPAVTDRPDIVLLTLDAARHDHFGCYGYHRDTTPRIDALAAEAQVFSSASALAPYTLCSVPTMLTGRSFLHHGVVQPGHALSPQATTLAEALADQGYQTVAFSATPNNSRSLRLDQGYEEFVEMWREVEGAAAIDPHRLVEMVVEFLDSRRDQRPLHLQIHIVPPHEPYDPPPAFDIFGDPSYAGICDGSRTTLEAIDRGMLQPSAADLEEITALYDGNLLRADHAVGVLLDALAARERWDRTVILITADHGEAFYEHGRMGHNSTLNDEMLRVPFILRLPPTAAPPDPCTGCLVSLADITPTLLGLAGGHLAGQVEGVDLLAGDGTEEELQDRLMVLRTSYLRPELGVRSSRWKLMASKHGHWRLFDLEHDPAEERDVFRTQTPVASGLATVLWRRLFEEPALAPDGPPSAVSEEEAKLLRALGYAGD